MTAFKSQTFPVSNPKTLNDIFRDEADFQDGGGVVSLTQSTPVNIGDAFSSIHSFAPNGGAAGLFKMQKMTITSNIGIRCGGFVRMGAYSGSQAGAIGTINFTIPIGGGQYDIDTSGLLFHEGSELQITINALEDCESGYNIRSQNQGLQSISTDPNYGAKFTYLCFGDSISWGTLGSVGALGVTTNYGTTHFSYRVSDSMRSHGIDVRRANRGFGGSVSSDWVAAILQGRLATQPFDLVTIGLGTNNAAGGMANAGTDTYTADMTFILNYLFGINPNASIILIGPPDSDTASRVPNLASYRTALQAIISGGTFSAFDLQYFDASSTYTANDTNCVEQGAGNHIHPRGDTGHVLYANGLFPVIQTSKFYTTNKKS